jgi:protein SCO1/2
VPRRFVAILFALGVASIVAIALGVIGLSRAKDTGSSSNPVVTAPASPYEGAVLPPGVKAPDFALRDEDGKRVTMRQFRGKVTVVTFLYSHCKTECPVQAQQIKGALDDLGHDVPALAISVDPPGDTPASVKRFNRKMEMTGRLRWALGDVNELRELWRDFAIKGTQNHTGRIVLVDRQGRQRIGFPVSQTTPERLAHDIRALEREPG